MRARMWARLGAGVRVWIPTSFWAAALVQTVFLVALAASDGYDVARSGEPIRVFLTYATVFALFVVIHLAIRNVKWSERVASLVFVCFVAVNFARFETAGAFDYGFAHENFREIFTPLGRTIATANVELWEVALLLFLPIVLGLVVVRWPLGTLGARHADTGLASLEIEGGRSRARAGIALACFALLVGLPLARVSTHESLTGFLVSALRFHAESRAAAAGIAGAPYPFVHETVPTPRTRAMAGADKPRPNVIVLFMESWSGYYTDRARPDGRTVTPVFDRRRREGLTYDHFYGNSVQSSRGHFTALCSIIPMFRGKEFVDVPATRFHCLPQVMSEAGYRTFFFSATADPEFDFADQVFKRIGFADVRWAEDRKTANDPAVWWGTGIQDDVFYRRFFAAVDEKVAREPEAPIFAVLANTSNHYPFNRDPHHVPVDGYATKYQRDFVASLSVADAWLETFFEELERRPAFRDAIVVLIGDHSFPADEHGIHFNGLGAYEEAFRTGFALRWKGHVPPHVDTEDAGSQLDLAPTIVDLLQLRIPSHFTGTSLFADGADRPPVPLVQPYDGVRLAAVKWPFKLVRHESAEQEQLYDLATDPDETHNRIADPLLAADLPSLRATIARIHASEPTVRANRVWPP